MSHKYYICEYRRATHDYDNEMGEWVYRGDKGMPKYAEWQEYTLTHPKTPHYSLGVHAFRGDGRWEYLRDIIGNTVAYFQQESSEFRLINPVRQRQIVRAAILKEFETLIKLDMVRVRKRLVFVGHHPKRFIRFYNS